MNLVTSNRKTRYDVWQSLYLDNMLVSEIFNSFSLKHVYYDLVSDSVPFRGYRAADMLQSLLKVVTKDDFSDISSDVSDLFSKIREVEPNDKLIYYHDVFLNTFARAITCVKIHNFLFNDIGFIDIQDKWMRRTSFFPRSHQRISQYGSRALSNR